MRYVFGDCVLDTQRYLLHRAGQPVRLLFHLLTYLLVHRDRVVTKQEMSEAVWKGQVISDATLESTLAAVRRATLACLVLKPLRFPISRARRRRPSLLRW